MSVTVWDCLNGSWALRVVNPTPEQSLVLRASRLNFEFHPQEMTLLGWSDYCESISGSESEMNAVAAELGASK